MACKWLIFFSNTQQNANIDSEGSEGSDDSTIKIILNLSIS